MASLVKTDKISTTAGGAQEFTIPAADGTANQHLKTDGSGILGWASPPSANPLTLTGSTNTWIPTITGADALTGTANFTYDGNTLDVKNGGTASSIKLYCETSNQHYQEIKAAPHSGSSNWTLTLPPTVPSVSGQALTATTAGVATWATVGGDNTPAFQAHRSSNQTISNDAYTLVEFNTEDFDTDSGYNNTTFTYTVPAGEGGVYWIYFHLDYTSDSNSNAEYGAMQIRINAETNSTASFSNWWNLRSYPGRQMMPWVAGLRTLAAADTIKFYAYGADMISPGNWTIQGSARRDTLCGAYKMIGIT